MRDMPLVLHVPWGKVQGRYYVKDLLIAKKDSRAGQKKEEPRGNGARRKRKT